MSHTGRRHKLYVRPQLFALLLVVLCVSASAVLAGTIRLVGASQNFIQPARVLPSRIRHAAVLADKTVTAAPTTSDQCHQVSCIALTFDDGPNPLTTPQVLADLEQAHIPATFFVVGSRVAGNEALLQRMHNDGDEIGNHSWNHPDFTKLTNIQIQQQIQLTQQAVTSAGVPAPTVFRPPYGAVDLRVERNIPLSILLWNEDPRDWQANTAAQVVAAVEASAKPGGIIDMHDIYHITADALPKIVSDLSARGYHFVTVDQLLNLTPSSRGVYYGHP